VKRGYPPVATIPLKDEIGAYGGGLWKANGQIRFRR